VNPETGQTEVGGKRLNTADEDDNDNDDDEDDDDELVSFEEGACVFDLGGGCCC
jgi:hypothetical protein